MTSQSAPAKKWRNRLRRFAYFCAVVAVTFAALAWWAGGKLIEPAQADVGKAPLHLPAENVSFASESGTQIKGWFIPADGAKATVLLIHPLRGNRRTMLNRADLLHQAGYSTLLFDLQSHGESLGEHITAGYLEKYDVTAAVEFIRQKNPNHQIAIIGWSLGGAASLLANQPEVDGLVLESVYPTINEAVHNRVALRVGPLHHLIAPTLLLQIKPRLGISVSSLRPIDSIAKVNCPVLIAAGDADQRTTIQETARLFDAATGAKRLVIFEGAKHEDLLLFCSEQGSEQYRQEILAFLKGCLQATEPNSLLE